MRSEDTSRHERDMQGKYGSLRLEVSIVGDSLAVFRGLAGEAAMHISAKEASVQMFTGMEALLEKGVKSPSQVTKRENNTIADALASLRIYEGSTVECNHWAVLREVLLDAIAGDMRVCFVVFADASVQDDNAEAAVACFASATKPRHWEMPQYLEHDVLPGIKDRSTRSLLPLMSRTERVFTADTYVAEALAAATAVVKLANKLQGPMNC